MGKVYNPPPGWPVPPTGWHPEPGWQPDPGWGPLPDGWSLWVRPNRHPFLTSLLVGLAVCLAGADLILLRASSGITQQIGGWTGRCVAVAVLVGVAALTSGTRWRWWTYLLATLAGHLVLATLAFLGRI